MRLLGKFLDPVKAQRFSKLLHSEKIANQIERIVNTDWGSDQYGSQSAAVWIVDEDQVAQALDLMDKFLENPDDEESLPEEETPIDPQAVYPHIRAREQTSNPSPKARRKSEDKTGPITLYIIFFCSLLFAFIDWQSPHLTKVTDGLPLTPVLSSPLRKELFFDYPEAYSYIDKILALYGPNKYASVKQLPQEGQILYKQFQSTPIWQGLYDYTLESINPPAEKSAVGPFMEKIREGEIWRLITPAFMHGDIFHLIFNMLALLVLGKMMEARLGKWRYLIFMLITGIAANMAQYIMSGYSFLGFSGILCGMLGFIWMRQKVAAWEGYPLQPGAFSFTLFFVLAIAAAQTVAFLFSATNAGNLPINVANTAHLTGGIAGLLLGKLSYFECKFKD